MRLCTFFFSWIVVQTFFPAWIFIRCFTVYIVVRISDLVCKVPVRTKSVFVIADKNAEKDLGGQNQTFIQQGMLFNTI